MRERCKNCPYFVDDDEITKEKSFVYDNEEYKFYLDDYTREFSYLLTRFHIVTDMEHAKKFLDVKMFFEGLLSELQMPVKCYIAGFERDGIRETFKISIVAEEIKTS